MLLLKGCVYCRIWNRLVLRKTFRALHVFFLFISTTYISNNSGLRMVLLCSFNAKTGNINF